jgi:hypothetical protein
LPTALDNGQRSPRKLLAAVVRRLLVRYAERRRAFPSAIRLENEREALRLPLIPPSYLFMNPMIQLRTSGMSTRDE